MIRKTPVVQPGSDQPVDIDRVAEGRCRNIQIEWKPFPGRPYTSIKANIGCQSTRKRILDLWQRRTCPKYLVLLYAVDVTGMRMGTADEQI
jgi:hypothetical protein